MEWEKNIYNDDGQLIKEFTIINRDKVYAKVDNDDGDLIIDAEYSLKKIVELEKNILKVN